MTSLTAFPFAPHRHRIAEEAATPAQAAAVRATLVALLALGAATLLIAQPSAAGDYVSSVHRYHHFMHWVSMGRGDLAPQQFTDDAVMLGSRPARHAG